MKHLESVNPMAFLVIVSGRVQINAGETGLKMREVCQEACCRQKSWAHDVKPAGSGIQITSGVCLIKAESPFF